MLQHWGRRGVLQEELCRFRRLDPAADTPHLSHTASQRGPLSSPRLIGGARTKGTCDNPPRYRGAKTKGERGFTLVEVLVALSIAAIAMVALFRAATQSTSASVSVENHLMATALARSLLLETAQSPLEAPFTRKGSGNGFEYAIAASSLQGSAGRLAPRGMALYDVTVTVSWEPSGRYELSTVVLGK